MSEQKTKRAFTTGDVTDWWTTEIVDIAPGSIRLRGYAIEDLIGAVSFHVMIWLMLRGELPTEEQADLFAAVLVAGVDHGPQAPSIAIARMQATCAAGINAAIASGVNALGDVHGGAGQQCMELLADIDRRHAAGATLDAAVVEGVDAFHKRSGAFIPGFGHRFHRTDPRTVKLAALVREAARTGVVSGRFLTLGEKLEAHIGRGKSDPPPMNVDGMTAVVLSELGFPAELGRGVFVLSRSVGICAHAYEQSQRKERIKGPTPPAAGFRYRGVPPRAFPREGKDRLK